MKNTTGFVQDYVFVKADCNSASCEKTRLLKIHSVIQTE